MIRPYMIRPRTKPRKATFTVSIYLDEELLDRLDRHAAAEERSRAYAVREILERTLPELPELVEPTQTVATTA